MIGIKDTEIPNQCIECRFCEQLNHDSLQYTTFWCNVMFKELDSDDVYIGINDNCPLIEIIDEEPTCSTCKNNKEFPPPHTCDICNSLDEEFGCMYKGE